VTLAFKSLGFSPLQGKAAIDQCNTLRRQLHSILGPIEEVSLLLVTHSEWRCEVRAVFDREDDLAAKWVLEAEKLAAEVWNSLKSRRRAVEK
jgi:hypothetical protein